jgi:hypothetical protein
MLREELSMDHGLRYPLFHFVPSGMLGHTLYPLRELGSRHPETHAAAAQKYTGREDVLRRQVRPLGCGWGDVLHLSPVDPRKILGVLRQHRPGYSIGTAFWVIDASLLDPAQLAVYRYHLPVGGRGRGGVSFAPFALDRLGSLADLPATTIEYYRACLAQDTRPLLFEGVPHVFCRGSINVSAAPCLAL